MPDFPTHVEIGVLQERRGVRTPTTMPVTQGLLIAASFLAGAELAEGTAPYFALSIFAILVMTILTISIVGFSSIAGILISYCSFRYFIFSQIAKIMLGQPAESNLAAPEMTIAVLTVGTASMCLGAVLVGYLLRDRIIIKIKVTPILLSNIRNISFIIGAVMAAVNYVTAAQGREGVQSYGGIVGLSRMFAPIIYMSVLAETWNILMRTGGRKSTSAILFTIAGSLVALGVVGNSKEQIANPVLMYFIACFSYRHYVSRLQIVTAVTLLFMGAVIVYPVVNMMRDRIDAVHSPVAVATEMIDQAIDDPTSLMREWELTITQPVQDRNLQEQGLYYLGTTDALLQRFLLIANTDVIVRAVDDFGPYGTGLITEGFEVALPTILAPNKSRVGTSDLITWYYGLRPDGVVGSPTVGLIADCYAALEWAGVIIIPVTIMLIFLFIVQVFGTNISHNFAGAYLLLTNFHAFGEANIEEYVIYITKILPANIVAISGIIFLAEFSSGHRRSRNRG
jgi:hypothetical protein